MTRMRSSRLVVIAGLATTALVIVALPASSGAAKVSAVAPALRATFPGASACSTMLSSFGTTATSTANYSSPAQSIIFPTPVVLSNPATSGLVASAQKFVISFTAYGVNGTAVKPSVASPVTVSFYGAPANAITTVPKGVGVAPHVITLTARSSITVTYSGSYLARPLTLAATMKLPTRNPCTKTRSYAIGSTTLQLANAPVSLGTASYSTPTTCPVGTSGSACAVQNVASSGLGLSASVGYGTPLGGQPATTKAATGIPSNFTIDTGSIGTALPLSQIGPDAIGPGPLALEYYDSSGNEFLGFTYFAPVTFQMSTGAVTTDPIRVLGVVSSACHAGKPCTQAPGFSGFHYLGVGFARSGTASDNPFQSPRDNALLAIEPTPGLSMSQGYILSGSTITAGITPADSAGVSLVALTPDTAIPGDWNTTPGCVSFPTTANPAPTAVCGSLLMDVGIGEMFITFANTNVEPAAVLGGLKPNQSIAVFAGTQAAPALTDSFAIGAAGGVSPPTPVGMAPTDVELAAIGGESSIGGTGLSVFINTGRHVLFQNAYLFNAQSGDVGFIPLNPPLR